jgi:hypothetical protein
MVSNKDQTQENDSNNNNVNLNNPVIMDQDREISPENIDEINR